jgi:hypothetical protein
MMPSFYCAFFVLIILVFLMIFIRIGIIINYLYINIPDCNTISDFYNTCVPIIIMVSAYLFIFSK